MEMKKHLISLSVLALTLTFSGAFAKEHEKSAHWGYTGDVSSEHWGELSDKFKLCSTGKNQSPIDVKSNFDVNLEKIKFDYSAKTTDVSNNGHTIQVDVASGSKIVSDGKTFELKQFHFHTPSENKINGKSFPLEAHFVHRMPKENTFAVVAVMFEEGAANPVLEEIWNKMPKKAREKVALDKAIDYTKLLPKDQDYYRFNGSFTTPPCTEGVYWHVMKKPLSASKAQIEKFLEVMHHPNNRDIQDIDARIIVE